MRQIVLRLLAMGGVIVLVGCGGGAQSEKVAALEARLTAAEADLRAAQAQLIATSMEVALMKIETSDTAWFDPQAQQAYSAVKTPVGPVLFVLERVDPYLDGYKVTFRVGNPSTALLTGFGATVEYGRARPEGERSELPPTKKVDLKFTDTIRPGAWSLVTANLAPAKADEIRRIGITPSFNNVSLRGP